MYKLDFSIHYVNLHVVYSCTCSKNVNSTFYIVHTWHTRFVSISIKDVLNIRYETVNVSVAYTF